MSCVPRGRWSIAILLAVCSLVLSSERGWGAPQEPVRQLQLVEFSYDPAGKIRFKLRNSGPVPVVAWSVHFLVTPPSGRQWTLIQRTDRFRALALARSLPGSSLKLQTGIQPYQAEPFEQPVPANAVTAAASVVAYVDIEGRAYGDEADVTAIFAQRAQLANAFESWKGIAQAAVEANGTNHRRSILAEALRERRSRNVPEEDTSAYLEHVLRASEGDVALKGAVRELIKRLDALIAEARRPRR